MHCKKQYPLLCGYETFTTKCWLTPILFILYVLQAIIDGVIHNCLANFLVYTLSLSREKHIPFWICSRELLSSHHTFHQILQDQNLLPPKMRQHFFPCCERKKQTNSICEVVIFFRNRLTGKAQSIGVLAMCAGWWENTEKGRFLPFCGWE